MCATVLMCALAACEDVSHDNIDRWQRTENGPEKLQSAVKDAEVDTELRAHAAQNLIAMGELVVVVDALEAMAEEEAHALVAALVPRLWEDARVEGRMDRPTGVQAEAKDALFELRSQASGETVDEIDQYLIEWLAGGYYEGRAESGRLSGKTIVRALGPEVAPKLVEQARSIIAKPPDEEGRRAKLGDNLLLGLAVSGSPEAVEFLLDLATGPTRGDDSLPRRVMASLEQGYVEPLGIEPAPGSALVPYVDRLASIARSEGGGMTNTAAALLRAAGPPHCLEPLVKMVGSGASEEAYRWMGAQKALRCAGADAIAPVVEALPEDNSYSREILKKYVWDEALVAGSKSAVATRARELLGADSWVARITGIELLGALAIRGSAAEDAERLRRLSGDRATLRGWNGESGGRAPRLGERAVEVARDLDEVAK